MRCTRPLRNEAMGGLSLFLSRLTKPLPVVVSTEMARRSEFELLAALDAAPGTSDLLELLEATADDEANIVTTARGRCAALLLRRLDESTRYAPVRAARGARRKRAAQAEADAVAAERRAMRRDERYVWLAANVSDIEYHDSWSGEAFCSIMESVASIGGAALPAALEGMALGVPRRLERDLHSGSGGEDDDDALSTAQLSTVAMLLLETCPAADATQHALASAARCVAERGLDGTDAATVADLACSVARGGVVHIPFVATVARDVERRAARGTLRLTAPDALSRTAWALGRFVADFSVNETAASAESVGPPPHGALAALADEIAARGRSGCLDGRDFNAAAVHRAASGIAGLCSVRSGSASPAQIDSAIRALRVLAGEVEAMSHAPNRADELVATLTMVELEELAAAFDVAKVRTPGAHAASAAWWRSVQNTRQ